MAQRSARPSAAASNGSLGLRLLGLRLDSDSSPLHTWAQRLPYGMFDGHGSVFPAPDHLIFHGLARCTFSVLFKALPSSHRPVVAASLRDALGAAGYKKTKVYNERRGRVNKLQIHEWAATLTVGPVAVRRVLPDVLDGRPLAQSAAVAGLEFLEALSAFASTAFFYPRVELDGGRACRARYLTADMEAHAEGFLLAVNKICLRPDCDSFSGILDVPNTHRFRELLFRTIEAPDHIRDILELPLESFHQTLKRSIASGNGRDDAGHALQRYVEQEAVSRLSLDPSVVGVPAQWCLTQGIALQLQAATPLWSQVSDDWSIGRDTVAVCDVPFGAQRLVSDLLHHPDPGLILWRKRCTRTGSERAVIGDDVAVLTSSSDESRLVDAAVGPAAYSNGAHVSFFRVCALLKHPCGQGAAVVHPFSAVGSDGTRRLLTSKFLFLRMQVGVRRALSLHVCDALCGMSPTGGLLHSDRNEWRLLGRRDGFPSRSG